MCVTSYSHIVHYQFTVSHNTRSYVATTSPDSSTRSTKADQLTVDLARRAHQSPGCLVDEDGLRGLPLAQQTGQGQSGVAFLAWELVRLQEPLHRRRREDGLNSTHIFPVKSATACTEVTVAGKMSIGLPKDRCRRILSKLAVCARKTAILSEKTQSFT